MQHTNSTNVMKQLLRLIGLAGVAFIILIAPAMGASPAVSATVAVPATPAASADRAHPTPLIANQLKGALADLGTESFYSFLAGPGDLVVTVDVKSTDGIANLTFEVLDKDAANSLMSSFAQADGTDQSGRKIETVKLDSQTTVVLLLRKSGIGTYTIRFSGAIVETATPSTKKQ